MPAFLQLDGLVKRFGAQTVVDGVDLEVQEGEIVALVGPSGSGKTTLLRLLAGFETPDAGRVLLRGEDVTRRPPARRGFGMVFQHYALFPHLSVGENVAFGLGGSRLDRVLEVLRLVDLSGFEDRRVSQLSGGQQQRVALARALAPEPCLLLLDEPLSSLDPTLRHRTRRELAEAIRRVGLSTVLVTHDAEEAFELGDRVAVIAEGRLEQAAHPEEIYHRPASRFVATFVGRANVLSGVLEGAGSEVRLDGLDVSWKGRRTPGVEEGAVELVVRPEQLVLAEEGERSLAGTRLGRRFLGPLTYQIVQLDSGALVEVLADDPAGERVAVLMRPGAPPGWIFPRAP